MKIRALIAGGGLAGLACARELYAAGSPYLLVEKEKDLGGLCRTVRTRGFTFDYTGHFLHFNKPEMKRWVLSLMGGELAERRRHAAIYSEGIYSEYPYQENNAGLPASVVRENVLGYLEATLRRRFQGVDPGQARDFAAWCLQSLGPGLSRHFMFPYNRKLWKFPLERLTPRWMGRFVPAPRVGEVVRGAFRREKSETGYNATFLYPKQGGISALPQALALGLPNLWRGVSLTGLDLSRRKASLAGGLEVDYGRLVSSLPLPRLLALARGLPGRLQRAARALKATSIYNINFGFKGGQPIPYSWVYFPGAEYLFHRAGSVSACVPRMVPEGHFSLYVEFSYAAGTRPDPQALGRHALSKLRALGWVGKGEPAVRVDLNLPGAYVVYDEDRESATGELLRFLERQGVDSVGRYGRWEYGSMESALDQGRQAAARIV
ncbi:MAG TPA: FAD-dependent oxidoreductase [bacterium]|nr:FAD-dependent oxidoreductase [bacterium]